jgi:phage portal protein BeeE
MKEVIERFEIQGTLAGPGPVESALELRVALEGSTNQQIEEALGSLTAFEGSPIPWPLEPATVIDAWYGNPWLGAIGRLLADALASARYDLEPVSRRPDGTRLGRGPGQTPHDERQYDQGMAWLEREDLGQDGLSLYSLPELVRTLALHLDQTGNVFVEVVRDRMARAPLRLAVLLPQYVSYVLRRDGGVARPMLYQLDPYQGQQWFVPFGSRQAGSNGEREFLHQRLPNSASNVYGLPPWIEARQSVEVDNAHRAYLRQFFRAHAAPRWLIEVTQDPDWNGPQPSQAQVDQVRALIVGYLNANAGEMAGRNLVLSYPGGIAVRVTSMDHKLEDPTFGSTARNARDEILAVRHVSLINLGLPEGGYRATAEQQSDNFERSVLEPFAAPILSLLNRVLRSAPPSGLGITDYRLTADFRDVDIIQQRIEAVVKAVGRPILTGDEGRKLIGYEPRGDDEVLVPAGLVPTGGLTAPEGPDGGGA